MQMCTEKILFARPLNMAERVSYWFTEISLLTTILASRNVIGDGTPVSDLANSTRQ
jgi:hypothetical protein